MESHSDPSSGSRFAVSCHTRAHFPIIISLSFGIQSRRFILAFRATSQFWYSEPPSSLSFGIQSHCQFFVRRSKPQFTLVRHSEPSLQFLVFRAIIPFQLGVRSHRVFSFTMFRVVFLSMTFLVTYSVRHAELLFQIGIHRCFFWLGIQSRCFVLAFRAVGHFFRLTFRVACSVLALKSHQCHVSQFRRSEPSSLPSLTFRFAFLVNVQSHHHHFS